MSKAKVKITVKSGKKGSGTLLAGVPLTVVKNDNPSGKMLYQTRAQVGIHVRTTRGGKPRIKSRF